VFASNDPFGYHGMLTDFMNAVRSGNTPRFTLDMAQRDLHLLELCHSERGCHSERAERVGESLASR